MTPPTAPTNPDDNADLAHELLCEIEDGLNLYPGCVTPWEFAFVRKTRAMLNKGKEISERQLETLIHIHMKAG